MATTAVSVVFPSIKTKLMMTRVVPGFGDMDERSNVIGELWNVALIFPEVICELFPH